MHAHASRGKSTAQRSSFHGDAAMWIDCTEDACGQMYHHAYCQQCTIPQRNFTKARIRTAGAARWRCGRMRPVAPLTTFTGGDGSLHGGRLCHGVHRSSPHSIESASCTSSWHSWSAWSSASSIPTTRGVLVGRDADLKGMDFRYMRPDTANITERHRSTEPRPDEDDEGDFYWISED